MSGTGLSLLGRAALAYAKRGRAVLPIKPRGKTPLTKHGLRDASTNMLVVQRWWARWPLANVGCATGEVSGFWTLDIDGLDGEAALGALEREHGQLPQTIEMITGRGRQILFAYTEPIRNSAGRLGVELDVRGDGGFTVLPPSVHPTGKVYSWSVDGHPSEVALVPAPEWLLAKLRQPMTDTGQPLSTSPGEWCDLLARGTDEGCRDDTITRLAGHYLHMDLDGHEVLELLTAWNEARCRPPLSREQVAKCVASIMRAEMASRERQYERSR